MIKVNERHGMTDSHEYVVWIAMKSRCFNENHTSYKDYGGRGITVCDRWRYSFSLFLKDMGRCPSPNHKIERINNNKGYFKKNCKWATQQEQAKNRRNSILINHNGETLTVKEWAEAYGLKYHTLAARLRRGWDIKTSLNANMYVRFKPRIKSAKKVRILKDKAKRKTIQKKRIIEDVQQETLEELANSIANAI